MIIELECTCGTVNRRTRVTKRTRIKCTSCGKYAACDIATHEWNWFSVPKELLTQFFNHKTDVQELLNA